MTNKKTNAAEKARLAAEAQEKIDEMATTRKYEVDKGLQKAGREVRTVAKPLPASQPARNG